MNLPALRRAAFVRSLVRSIGVHRVNVVVRLLQLPPLALVGLVVRRLPRDRRLVVLGSPLDRFADNAAYLFIRLDTVAGPLQAVWISGSQVTVERLRAAGLPAELRWSRAGIRACLRAGAFVYSGYRSDINRWLSPGALAVSLWHGVPIKRIEKDLVEGGGLLARLAQAGTEPPPDYLLSTSPEMTRLAFSTAFGVPPERCWELGYPRNDHLVLDEPPPPPLAWPADAYARLTAAERVVGLFMTWRDNRVDDVVDASLIASLAAVCRRHGAVLAYKAHFNVAATSVAADGLVLVPNDADLQAYAGLCDAVITDYSSVAMDFLLTRQPVLYFMPDLEEYAAARGFYVDPLSLPGRVVRRPEELVEALDGWLADPSSWSWSKADEAFLRSVWGPHPGAAAAAVTEALIAALELRNGAGRLEFREQGPSNPPCRE
ncbi:MAG: teichoic acid glycerol-phosphate transferase [Nocardioidaceae bacterium]|nr:teichoic acid glycerol-phosphate transferase [Nocardioidaceae bacterium]